MSTQHQAGRFTVEGQHRTMFPRGDKFSLLVLKAEFSSSVQTRLSIHDRSGVLLCMK